MTQSATGPKPLCLIRFWILDREYFSEVEVGRLSLTPPPPCPHHTKMFLQGEYQHSQSSDPVGLPNNYNCTTFHLEYLRCCFYFCRRVLAGLLGIPGDSIKNEVRLSKALLRRYMYACFVRFEVPSTLSIPPLFDTCRHSRVQEKRQAMEKRPLFTYPYPTTACSQLSRQQRPHLVQSC